MKSVGVEKLEQIVYVALAPFYAAAVACVYYGLMWGAHTLRRLDQSATETRLTETLNTKSENGGSKP
jgi:hypothetical protein